MQSIAPTISESLLTLPADWILEPVCGKRPYRKGWTKSNVDRLSCLKDLESGKATGIGLKLGEGLLAIDVDGDGAAKLLRELAGENSLQEFSQTVAWSSGRKGRKQYLFSVPESEWGRIRNLSIGTGAIGEGGKEESLEFRWLGTQSVLPPSIHPITNRPYFWEKSPYQAKTVQAPEWLLTLCENWTPEYAGEGELDLIRFPARLYKFFKRSLAIWLLARRSDNSRRIHGKNKGSGIGSFHLSSAASVLNRSEGHVRKLLCAAKKSGLLREYTQQGDLITCYYTSFEKVLEIAGLDDIGSIAAIEIDALSNLHILATEIETQHQQKLTLYCKRQEEIGKLKSQGKDPGKIPTRIVQPGTLHTCEIPARVLARGSRFDYFESGFQFYGGSQKAIALSRGISPSTVSRHLSNSYRMEPTPIQQKRSGIPPIIKRQLLEQLPRLKGMPANLCTEDGLLFLHENWWKPHPNIYLLEHRLVSARRRRSRIKAQKIDKVNL